MEFDTRLKLSIYRSLADTGHAPRIRELPASHAVAPDEVVAALARLRALRLVVLEPGTGEICMAPPFSAVPTSFEVTANGRTYHANCVWDAYGIAAALHADADVSTRCGCCGDPMTMAVRAGAPVATAGLAHFAVPARRWWYDIVHT